MKEAFIIYAAFAFCFASAANDVPSIIESRDAVLGMIRLQSGMSKYNFYVFDCFIFPITYILQNKY